jgi:hypothetical protein
LDIDVEKFLRMKRQAVAFILFDLRDEASFGEGHIQGAFNVPLKRFLKEVKKSVPQKTTPIVIYDEGSDALPEKLLESTSLEKTSSQQKKFSTHLCECAKR